MNGMKNELVLGTWQFGDNYGFWKNESTNGLKKLIIKAKALGIRTFDTAYSYQNCETLLSAYLDDDTKIFTKVMPTPSFERKIMTCLKRLKKNHIETLFIHWPTNDDAVLSSCIRTLEKLKKEGIISNTGYSNFPLSLLKKLPHPDMIQRPVSLLWQKELNETQLWCRKNDIKLVGYSPLAMGLLTGKYRNRKDLDDKRKDFYVLNYPSIFDELLSTLNTVGKKYNTDESTLSLSWARDNADYTIFGARNIGQLESDLGYMKLDAADSQLLKSKGEELSRLSLYDNPLNHQWEAL